MGSANHTPGWQDIVIRCCASRRKWPNIGPLRAIAEALGAKVEWDEVYHTATITKAGNRVILTIDKNIGYFNGQEIPLDVPARTINNRTMVPLRFVSDYLGANINWDENSQTIDIKSKVDDPFKNRAAGITFEKVLSNTSMQRAFHVKQTKDGGYIIVGSTLDSILNKYPLLVIKTNVQGDIEWSKTYEEIEINSASEMQITNDGGFILTGIILGLNGSEAALIKFTASGEEVWSRSYGQYGFTHAYSVQITQDGGYIMVGSKYRQSGYVLKTDKQGIAEWGLAVGNPGDWFGEVQQTADGGYIVAGNKFLNYPEGARPFLLKINNTGKCQWSKEYDLPKYNSPQAIWQNSDKGYCLWTYKHHLIKTDENGNMLWDKSINIDDTSSGQPCKDGGYIIAGTINPSGPGLATGCLVRLNNDGEQIFIRVIGTELPESFESVQETTDGGFIIAGTAARNHTNIYLVKTDSNGNVYYN